MKAIVAIIMLSASLKCAQNYINYIFTKLLSMFKNQRNIKYKNIQNSSINKQMPCPVQCYNISCTHFGTYCTVAINFNTFLLKSKLP